MKVLMVYPEFPDTFWSFKHALPFQGKRSAFPPLGLLTVSAMLPKHWEKRLVDLNVRRLKDSDLEWADVVFFSGMIVQGPSMKEQIARAKRHGQAHGGRRPDCQRSRTRRLPKPTTLWKGEAEEMITQLAEDLERGDAQAALRLKSEWWTSPRCRCRTCTWPSCAATVPCRFNSRAAALSPASSATSSKSTAAARAPRPPIRCARNSTSFTAWAGAARFSWWMTTSSAIRKA